MSEYPVGIVGESHYQNAIRRCSNGDEVAIMHEPTNRYDARALRVSRLDGQTIGYIPKDSWVHRAVLDERKVAFAVIKSVATGSSGNLGVVLSVSLDEHGGPARSSQGGVGKSMVAGILKRLFR